MINKKNVELNPILLANSEPEYNSAFELKLSIGKRDINLKIIPFMSKATNGSNKNIEVK
nr:hypothetical protein [Flavobacterium sp. 140616W15]